MASVLVLLLSISFFRQGYGVGVDPLHFLSLSLSLDYDCGHYWRLLKV